MDWLELAKVVALGYVAISVIGYTLYLIVSSFRIVRK